MPDAQVALLATMAMTVIQMAAAVVFFRRLAVVDPPTYRAFGSPGLLRARRVIPAGMWTFILGRRYRSLGDRWLDRLGNALVAALLLVLLGLAVTITLVFTG